ncbi:MAG TPA: glycerophosphodiester phosphodiesterase, partial [Afipia sp.]|nr:glycerophosphodiester phosphodiesterase [Afipia sp.]
MRIAATLSLLALTALPGFASAQTSGQAFPATLAGHAVMPAESFIEAPADAPADLKVSGKFTTGVRVDAVGTIEGKSFDRPTGVKLPFKGQPLQGHSGIKKAADGTFWVLSDNGFGSKANSPDPMLFLNNYRIDWGKGTVERVSTVFLRDPDKKVPFRIAN